MALTTFGAIMGFAAEAAEKAGEIYRDLFENAKDSALREILRALSEEEGKNHALMMKARRENVTEMILEPVAGLREEDYEIDLKGLDRTGDRDILKAALILEERGKRFFEQASSRIPLPEVTRIFRKMAQKKDLNLTNLQGLGLNQTLKQNA